MPKKIIILGSTGSIGTQTIEVLRKEPRWGSVIGLAAGKQVDKLIEQANMLGVKHLLLFEKDGIARLTEHFPPEKGYHIYQGMEGLNRLVAVEEADYIVSALVGAVGISATVSALKAGKVVALANKETLVAAGEIVMKSAVLGKNLIPIDSEHGGLFQCLQGHELKNISKLWLTASGGPFRGWKRERLAGVTPEQALKHPNWRMGGKITVDSATLMNKGLEIIEAHWLFNIPYEKIGVLIHPESIIHAMVEFVDGSYLAQLAIPDMKLPIQYALAYPERGNRLIERLDLAELGALHFSLPDEEAFPCLRLARQAGEIGGTMPAVLNAANEEAVQGFLDRKISFLEIAEVVEWVMDRHEVITNPDLEEMYMADTLARQRAVERINKRSDRY